MKKGIKRVLSVVLSVAVMISMSSVAFAAEMGTGSTEKSTKIVSTLVLLHLIIIHIDVNHYSSFYSILLHLRIL